MSSLGKRKRASLHAPRTYTQAIAERPWDLDKTCQGQLLSCTSRQASPVQLLDGVYAELFQLIYEGQTGNPGLDWGVYDSKYRRDGRSMGNLVKDDANRTLAAFMTQCRNLVNETHRKGFCEFHMAQMGQRQLSRASRATEGLLESFKAVQKLDPNKWKNGRPKFLDDIEVSDVA
jgi:hypothetical protein